MFTKTQIATAVALASSVLPASSFAAEEETKEAAVLERIEVTANRRVQNIADVPVSIAAISEKQFENLMSGGGDILQLALQVPGLYAESSNGRVAPRFYIRGLGNTDFDLAASQPVSVIMDDVVMENVILKSFPLFDMQQVEVFRGPQGSLFGRNSTAGIVKFDTAKPTDDLDGYVKLGGGNYGSQVIEGAVGGGITDSFRARVSVKDDRRDDWISNGFTNEKNIYGGHKDTAVRTQVEVDLTDRWDLRFSYQQRDLDGTSTMFRANVLDQGSNKLNGNYKRDEVYYNDTPEYRNFQKYKNKGYSLYSNLDLDFATLSYIGSLQKADGSGFGDIDGGNEGGPGDIPFQSNTADGADVKQLTHELRLASNNNTGLTWQGGFYWFDSELTVETDPFFTTPSIVRHDNKTWAVFGQVSYDFTDALTLVGGLRYTKDDKTLKDIQSNINFKDVTTDDSKVSGDLALHYKVSDDWAVFSRFAHGFRAPSIQGRDVAFFGAPSVAKSETVTSIEVGTKGDLLENTLRLNTALFAYQVNDPQFTAVGGTDNLVQLLNADKGKAYGIEFDFEWLPIENLLFTAGFAYQKTEIQDKNLVVGICAQCDVTNPLVTIEGVERALVNGNPFPQAPEVTGNLTARWSQEVGNGEIFAFTDWSYQGKTNLFIYESQEFNTSGQFEGGLRLGYVNFGYDLEVALYGRNITDESNIKGGIDFNNNTAFVNEPRRYGIEITKRFY
ncbi:TonB-dependent receptor [Paraferrimonas sedimenticola]|uniref:TonB-dependent receptor n=1 Tax=Paraferrimonas sedimenticola TaxID=375674 RepID=A0AA37W1R1_9GAMM|nr:TonB-dependent receptor [Paraferrimonas sedimenticola]GLP96642.1 TonB-dependent receptor [Paraferrimonas sedimenticola]